MPFLYSYCFHSSYCFILFRCPPPTLWYFLFLLLLHLFYSIYFSPLHPPLLPSSSFISHPLLFICFLSSSCSIVFFGLLLFSSSFSFSSSFYVWFPSPTPPSVYTDFPPTLHHLCSLSFSSTFIFFDWFSFAFSVSFLSASYPAV